MKRINNPENIFGKLQTWYLNHCNGDWEHLYGIRIDTLDNPGWRIEVDLMETVLEDKQFNEVDIQRADENDWIHCKVKSDKFGGACGPQNLEEMINIFLNWASEYEG